jgi:hypothetical protein
MNITTIGAFVLLMSLGSARGAYLKLPEGQIPLHSAAGIKLLEECDARANVFHLLQHLSWQQTLSACGVATAVTVLNTMQLANTPLCESLDSKYPYFDQTNFFSTGVEKVVSKSTVAKMGFTLAEWAAAVASYRVKTEAYSCGVGEGEIGFEAFLARAKNALKNPAQYLVVNFQRKGLGQVGVGHFCPVGAYHEKTNKFLILEVGIFEYPVYWVDAELLWKAMSTRDDVSKKNRGFVVITAQPGNS